MAGIRVVTVSAGDLPADLVAAHDIRIVPLDVRLGKWGPDEMRLIDPAEFWRRCAITPTLPETSAPSPGDFAAVFSEAADDGCDGVVCITLSAGLSATFQSAVAGAAEVRERIDVRVVDSRFVTIGEGMLVLEAVEAAATRSLDDLVAALEASVAKIRVYGTFDTVENLRKGGRIGAAQAMIGSLLSIKPVIEIRDGVVEPESRQRTRQRSLDYLVQKVRDAGPLARLAVAHAAAPDVDVVVDQLAEIYPRNEIVIGYIGPVIGTHSGPGCVGVCFRLA